MNKFLCLVAAALMLPPAMFSGELKRGTVTAVKGVHAAPIGIGATRFAGKGGFLVRFVKDTLVRYVSFDGQTLIDYDPSRIPRTYINDKGYIVDYASDGSDVFILSTDSIEHQDRTYSFYVSRFEHDGTYRGSAKLDRDAYSCSSLVVLGDNHFLVGCMQSVKFGGDSERLTLKPFLGMFQTNGQFVKQIVLPKDVTRIDEKSDPKDALEMKSEFEIEMLLNSSLLDRDEFGNVIIARFIPTKEAKAQPVLFSIDRYGSVRRIEIDKTVDKYGGPVNAKIIEGRIAVIYSARSDASERSHCLLRMYDLSGKVQSSYKYDPFDFGVVLLDISDGRSLFATQTGPPSNPSLGIIEALP